MKKLPSERKESIEKAIQEYRKAGKLTICEPCNCGSHIRHNNGGNYHEVIGLSTEYGGQHFVRFGSTCELLPPAEWEICENPEDIIREHGDWL